MFYVDRLWHPINLNFETSKNPIKFFFSCDVKKLNTFVREHPRTWKKLYFFKSSSKLQLVFEKLDDYLNHLRYAVCTWSLNTSSILHWKVFFILFLYFWKDKKNGRSIALRRGWYLYGISNFHIWNLRKTFKKNSLSLNN